MYVTIGVLLGVFGVLQHLQAVGEVGNFQAVRDS